MKPRTAQEKAYAEMLYDDDLGRVEDWFIPWLSFTNVEVYGKVAAVWWVV